MTVSNNDLVQLASHHTLIGPNCSIYQRIGQIKLNMPINVGRLSSDSGIFSFTHKRTILAHKNISMQLFFKFIRYRQRWLLFAIVAFVNILHGDSSVWRFWSAVLENLDY